MKKSLIAAGAASLALAAMPVVGVLAADTRISITDSFQLTLNNTCAFARNATTAHTAASTGTYPTDGAWGTTNEPHTYTGVVTNGSSYEAFATSKFSITCNNAYGYQVTVAPTAFTATGVNPETYPWAYSATGLVTGENADSSWAIAVSDLKADGGTNLSNNIITKRTVAPSASTDGFTITYSAAVDSNQPAGTYNASAVYTFAQLNSTGAAITE